MLRSHGITRNQDQMVGVSDGDWFYQQIDLGFNYRMNDLQAALGLSQLARVDQYVDKRHRLAKRYDNLLNKCPISLPFQQPNCFSSLHLYPVQFNNQIKKYDRTSIFQALRDRGIGVNVHYIPVHTHPHFQKLGFKWGDFPTAENYYKNAITLPLHQTLSNEEQDYIVENIHCIFQK